VLAALLVLLVLSLAATACGGGSGADIPLVYTYEVGDTWVHEMTTAVSGTTEGLGDSAPAEINETTKTRVTSKVESVTPEGVATITVTTETVELLQNGVAQDLTALLPQTVTVTMDPTGKLLSTQGGADAAAGLLDSGSFLDPQDLGSEIGSLVFPVDGKAKVGEQWTSTSTIPLSGLDQELTVTTKAKLTGVATENGMQVASVDYVTKLPMDLEFDLGSLFSTMFGSSDDGSTLDLVFKMVMKGAVEFGGTTKVDLATGRAVTSDTDGTMDISMEVTEAPEVFVPSDQRGPFSSKMTLAMQVTRLE
jgi:hypothetical protein